MGYRFLILGEPVVEGPAGRVDIRSRKGRALLWYCAAQSEREFPRATLAELFWGDCRTGLDSLGMTLVRLRRELPVWPLRITRQTVGWDLGSDIFLDIRRFNELLRLASEAETGEALAEAERLCRGFFLEGFDPAGNEELEIWLAEQRAYWDQRILELLSRLTRWREERSDWEGVIATAQRAIRLDPLREAFHRSLIQAYHRLGDRAAALSRYADCREILQEELGVEPDETTQALAGVIAQSPPVTVGFDSLRPPGPALAGREEVLTLLGAAFSSTGAPRVVLLAGETGAGKTRLVEEISRWAAPEGRAKWTVLRGHCREEDGSIPLGGLSEVLRASLPRFPRAWRDLPAVWRAEIGRWLPAVGEQLAKPAWPVADTEEGTRPFVEAVEHWLLALPRPSLLLLEDIHWADPASLGLLGRLARRTALGPIILLTVADGRSPEPVRRLLEQLEREGRLVRQEVDPPASKGTRPVQWRLVWKSADGGRDQRSGEQGG